MQKSVTHKENLRVRNWPVACTVQSTAFTGIQKILEVTTAFHPRRLSQKKEGFEIYSVASVVPQVLNTLHSHTCVFSSAVTDRDQGFRG